MAGKLVAFNAAARAKRNAEHTAGLDDFTLPRNEMATASEGCERRTVEKLKNPPVYDDRQLMVFERGHVFEMMQELNLIAMGFQKVTPAEFAATPGPCFVGGVDNQLALQHPTLPVGAHLDFVVKHKTGALFYIECKSTDGIPSEPYGEHIEQLHLGMGLLQLHYPDAEVRGSILSRDLNKGREHEFDGFSFNQTLFDYLLKKAVHRALAKQGKVEPFTTPGPLCGFCDHRQGCPAHAGAALIPEQILVKAEQLERLNASKKALEEEIDAIKAQLLEFTGEKYKGEAEGVTLVATTVGESTTVDAKKLESEFPDAFKACRKTKAGYTKVEVKRLKPTPAKAAKEPKEPKAPRGKKAAAAATDEAAQAA